MKNVWGSAAHIKELTGAAKVSKAKLDSPEYAACEKAAAFARGKKNNLGVHAAFACRPKKACCAEDFAVAHLSLGLNGKGRQADYLAALAKLLKGSGATLLEVYCDVEDDLMDALVAVEI